MNLTIKLGDQVISLIGTTKDFKIAKLTQVQKWFMKNETEINSHSHLPSVIERHKETQERLKSYMSIIKQSAITEGQGVLWDCKDYFKYLKSQIKVTSPRELERVKTWETLNQVDREFLHEFMGEYLKHQKTDVLVDFLSPVLADHLFEIKEIEDMEGE